MPNDQNLPVSQGKQWVAANKTMEVIGEDPIKEALAYVAAQEGEGSKAAILLERMLTPAFAGHSLAKKMRDSGLTLPEVVDIFGQYQIAIGTMRAQRHMPDVLEDIAIDSKSKWIPCTICDGEGQLHVDDPETGEPMDMMCAECKGAGGERLAGNNDARKIFMELSGLTKRGPAIAINNNTQVNNNFESKPESVTVEVQRLLENG